MDSQADQQGVCLGISGVVWDCGDGFGNLDGWGGVGGEVRMGMG